MDQTKQENRIIESKECIIAYLSTKATRIQNEFNKEIDSIYVIFRFAKNKARETITRLEHELENIH